MDGRADRNEQDESVQGEELLWVEFLKDVSLELISVIEDRLYDLEMICLSILRTSKHSTAIQLKNWFLFLECQS